MLEKQQMEQKYIDNAALQQEEPALTTGYRDKKITMDIIGSSILWSLHNVQLWFGINKMKISCTYLSIKEMNSINL